MKMYMNHQLNNVLEKNNEFLWIRKWIMLTYGTHIYYSKLYLIL